MVNTSLNRLLVPVTSRLCCLCCCLVWWDSLECVIAHSTIDLFFCVWSGSYNPRSSNTLMKDILRRRRSGYSLKAVQIFTMVAFNDRDDLCMLYGSSQTNLAIGKVQTLGSAVGSIVGMKIESRMLTVSSLKSAWKIHGVLEEWPIIRRYSSILLHSVLFSFFVVGFLFLKAEGVPHRLCLSLTKAHHFFSFFM